MHTYGTYGRSLGELYGKICYTEKKSISVCSPNVAKLKLVAGISIKLLICIAEIPTLPIWCLASRSPDFYQILPIYHKILKTRGKLLIFRIFGDLSLWNTHIILTFFAKSIMVCYNSGRNDVKIQEMALERT